MNLDEVKAEFESKWIAPDGLTYLNSDDHRYPFTPAQLYTVANGNGILYTAYALSMLSNLGTNASEAVSTQVISTLSQLTLQPSGQLISGLPNRNPGNTYFLDSHDNFIGILALSVLLNTKNAQELHEYGIFNFWSFNNMNPGKFNFAALRQPGEIAICQLAAGYKPSLFCWLWFLIGATIALNKSTTPTYSMNLLWLRIDLIKRKLILTPALSAFWIARPLNWLIGRYKIKVVPVSKNFEAGFDPEHPVHKLAILGGMKL